METLRFPGANAEKHASGAGARVIRGLPWTHGL